VLISINYPLTEHIALESPAFAIYTKLEVIRHTKAVDPAASAS